MPIKRTRQTVCLLCTHNVDAVTFRDTDVLRRFISSQNKILPRKKTGSCTKHQRSIAREIKRAREMGLLGYRGQ
ncbi:MAG: 30S ribosomal protein S18 [Candidatus Andersenbacteria bacterium CG10_big_fil_rev_8_21_14_0_10_54_11]|uniref:Small ribosomal subunit protein bS18 n=1 Tax=Candidatus Andersenbacteria bacterium CG10_big_fil_rev_8_21_14_0_10_54_11 TaxID=1974485 RepID=A0A2M6WZB2_9BACT|nr:MAG: 30S ribosomal protein S18 [Candidatus Andersenbacteria bacterium CG10_big_fil_rev_8_21_14_0_10_54_11]